LDNTKGKKRKEEKEKGLQLIPVKIINLKHVDYYH